ncbi:MAG TPA: AMP-binding protein, partial [Burkholderiales bacterium]|nr:AMP-binding protein [Burkholderiales bacterium]
MTFDRHFAHWPPGAPRTLDIPRESVYRNLEATVARVPDRAAIDYYGSRLSYRELKRDVDALAGFLQQRWGVRRGDRVLLDVQNSPQFVISYYAILRADAVVVPVNPMNRTEELRHYVSDADAVGAIVGQDVLRYLEPLGLERVLPAVYSDYLNGKTDLPVPDFVNAPGPGAWREALAAGLQPSPHLAGADDLAVMPYTSGTTGKPKGCMHTHHSVQSTTVHYPLWRGTLDHAITLSALPMFHVTGMQASMNSPV